MDRWDLLLLGIAAYVAAISLVRLMAKRRNQVIQQYHRELTEQASAQAKKKVELSSNESDKNVA